ncbi:hypothetical protein DdX_05900 [Ditylenchus destructor]|uniref:Uncharacterized protein n=1 Tax=Ditylenchus destructor TaxID=166010 RepID=A0AAD4N8J5_9BILA|nr:hypothetical protein DdX_05900 [Ditylenchus destructor]
MDPAVAENVKKFSEIYGIATQLMNLGGNILSNANPVGGSRVGSSSSSNDNSGNGVLTEVRPQLRGVNNFENSPVYDSRSSGSNFGGLSEYGGGPLGAGSRSKMKPIQGSSIGSSGSSSPSSIFSPTYEGYGESSSRYGSAKQGSNIEAIVDALSRSGAKRAEPEAESGAASLLSQFFGGGR